MRRSFDGLEAAVRERPQENPLSGALFVFWNRRRDRLKILSFDGSGLWIWYKRLESGRFELPGQPGDRPEISSADLLMGKRSVNRPPPFTTVGAGGAASARCAVGRPEGRRKLVESVCHRSRRFPPSDHEGLPLLAWPPMAESSWPVDPGGAMEKARSAFPTAPWTAQTARRPQAPPARRLRLAPTQGGRANDRSGGNSGDC
jgi:hypothetical protein